MCGRYGFTSPSEIYERFDIEEDFLDLKENYNVAPTQEMPVVEKHSPNSIHIRQWGIHPEWSKMSLINAQAEKLNVSSVWKKAFIESRCIVPANFFYEWKRTTEGKQPFLIRLKNKKMFGMAGLVVTYHDSDKKEKQGFVIITTTPNKLMANIHNRMPVILKQEDEEEWLNPDNAEPEKLLKLLTEYPSDEMEAYPISSLVNSPKNNFKEVMQPIKV